MSYAVTYTWDLKHDTNEPICKTEADPDMEKKVTVAKRGGRRMDCEFGVAAAKSLQSCPTLCDPIDGSPPGSPIPGILQARTLEWVAISFSNAWKVKSQSEVAQLCPTLSDPMDYSLPDSSIHGIFQARGLEWGAIAFSRVWG